MKKSLYFIAFALAVISQSWAGSDQSGGGGNFVTGKEGQWLENLTPMQKRRIGFDVTTDELTGKDYASLMRVVETIHSLHLKALIEDVVKKARWKTEPLNQSKSHSHDGKEIANNDYEIDVKTGKINYDKPLIKLDEEMYLRISSRERPMVLFQQIVLVGLRGKSDSGFENEARRITRVLFDDNTEMTPNKKVQIIDGALSGWREPSKSAPTKIVPPNVDAPQTAPGSGGVQ